MDYLNLFFVIGVFLNQVSNNKHTAMNLGFGARTVKSAGDANSLNFGIGGYAIKLEEKPVAKKAPYPERRPSDPGPTTARDATAVDKIRKLSLPSNPSTSHPATPAHSKPFEEQLKVVTHSLKCSPPRKPAVPKVPASLRRSKSAKPETPTSPPKKPAVPIVPLHERKPASQRAKSAAATIPLKPPVVSPAKTKIGS